MSDRADQNDLWQHASARERDSLIVSLPSFEGPLALLLDLARQEKIDLARISILALAEQYLTYVSEARALRLELAADYLVMAAWLAYLKSALLLPPEDKPDPDPNVLAEQLRWRLQRLQAMRDSSDRLQARPMLGRDVFARGAPEGLRRIVEKQLDVDLYDLLKAYAALHARPDAPQWAPHARADIISLEQALQRLRALVGATPDWTELQQFLPPARSLQQARSALASSFVAALELARLGLAELSQTERFGPLHLRSTGKADAGEAAASAADQRG